ncbi:MAG: 30S ribosomal protein S16 [Patescibacteria group bacterium]|nr:30S ribosomal protein S16 [Patescibacteria group bacterium]
MLVLRLARTGKKKQAYFRIVVAEKERAVTSKFVEILGNYNPHEKKLEIDKEKLEKYLSNGAQPSNTLAKLLKKEGISMPKWVKIAERNRPPKKKDDEEKKEAPKEEVKEEGKKEEASTEAPVEEKGKDKPEEKEDKPAEKEAPKKEEKTKEPKEEEKDKEDK